MKNNTTSTKTTATVLAKVTIFVSLFISLTATAQTGFYVPQGANVFFAGDSASIYSNVINNGKVSVSSKAVVNFEGKKWDNNEQSTINADKGGVVRFVSADSTRQQLNGGYNAVTGQGAAFSTLQIDNKAGVELNGSTTKVTNELKLTAGNVYLNNNILVAGNKITGYDSSKYIVTGKTNAGSMLIREGIKNTDGQVVFPVGTTEHAYTPATITAKSNKADAYFVNVFDSVKAEVSTGKNLAANSVNKTWQIGSTKANEVNVSLQHVIANEGTEFAANRNNAYVSTFANNAWDTIYPQAAPVNGVNTRANVALSNSAYFTKFTGTTDNTLKTVVLLNGNRIDTATASIYWTTKPEVNVRYFVIERQLATETVFTAVDSVDSKAVNGISRKALSYRTTDANKYVGNSTYRLKLVDFAGNISYSNTVIIGNKAGVYNLMMWPNPATDKFFVSWNVLTNVKYIVVVNALGQKIKQVDVAGTNTLEVKGLQPGIYFVSYILSTGVNIETKKLVVAGI